MSATLDTIVVRRRAKAGSFIVLAALSLLHGATPGRAATTDGAAVTSQDLTQAAAAGHVDAVRSLLAGGAQVDGKDASDWTPLHFAAAQGWTDVAAILLDRALTQTPVRVLT